MRVERESLLGTLAVLGLAFAVAYLAADQDRPHPSHSPSTSDAPASADAFALGRGRHAVSPGGIPARGWKDILWRTYEQLNEDRLLAVAAGVVFYGLLALFPTITALVSSYALFADAKTVNDHMAFISGFLPEGTFSIIQDQVGRVLSKGDMKLGSAFLGSLLLAVWSANGGMKAIIDALNVVYDEKEKRGFIKLNAVSLAFTVGGVIGILFAIGLVVVTHPSRSFDGRIRLGG
jgi:membrane protein